MMDFAAALLGALIGAGAALGAQALSNRSEKETVLRGEKVQLVSQLWSACDRLWRVTRALNYTIYDLVASRSAGHHERLPALNERRLTEIAEKHSAETDASFLTAQLRLLYPSIADEAATLLDASARHDVKAHRTYEDKRQVALEAFETAARKLVS
jgi:hypothetical protein